MPEPDGPATQRRPVGDPGAELAQHGLARRGAGSTRSSSNSMLRLSSAWPREQRCPPKPRADAGDARRARRPTATSGRSRSSGTGCGRSPSLEDGDAGSPPGAATDATRRYPELAAIAEALGGREAILDGEIVAFDDDGRPSFQLLQRRMGLTDEGRIRQRAAETPVTYVAFDLLWLDGRSLLAEPYERRRELLAELGFDGAELAGAAPPRRRRRGAAAGRSASAASRGSSPSGSAAPTGPGGAAATGSRSATAAARSS